MWWPFWKMLLCTAAACTATAFGGFLWNNSYSTVQQIEKMQAIKSSFGELWHYRSYNPYP